MFEAIFITLIEAGIGVTLLLFIGDFFISSRRHRGEPNTTHFDGKRFFNLGWTRRESLKLEAKEDGKGNAFTAFCHWIIHRKPTKWVKRHITPIKPDIAYTGEGIRVTFIGHATLLIQVQGWNFLTDPVWSDRTSPFSWIGPKRYVNPGVNLDDLPPIDAILLSHNHYDHMDIATLRTLEREKNIPIYTGLGNAAYLEKRNITPTHDMDWFETLTLATAKKIKTALPKITFVPAQHFSSRGITDRNKTLWGGFVVEIGETRFYFAGDTGYGEFIEGIKKAFPKGIDLGLLPMGAYKPRWFMAPIHTNPEEALMMQKDLNIKTGIGIHYGTFPLADDGQDDPLIDLQEAKNKTIYRDMDFRTGDNGTVWETT